MLWLRPAWATRTWRYVTCASPPKADLDRDPNSAGGVRIAGLGAVWQAVVLGFAGLDLAGDVPMLAPKLPPAWRSLSFQFCWRGRLVAIRIAGGLVRATLTAGEAMDLRIGQTQHGLTTGTPLEVVLRRGDGP
jgi:trehalose/maltose hydrolase-like predicted phosphorylase